MTITISSLLEGDAQNIQWIGITTNQYGEPYRRSQYNDKCVQVLGNFGSGATVTLYGSCLRSPNLASDTDWFILTDTTETNLAFTSASGAQILQNPRWIRPKVTGGTSPAVNVHIEAMKAS